MPASQPTRASAFLFLCACFATLPLQAQQAPTQAETNPSAALTPKLRAQLWVRASVDPMAWMMPGLNAAFSMAHPPQGQPAAWRVGAEGFAQLYAGYLARQSAATSVQTVTAALLREDNRYQPAHPGGALRRAAHATSFALLDRSASGRRMPAISSFAAAFTAAELANTWLAPQFQNSTHLAQRTLTSLAGIAGSDLATEFRPDAARLTRQVTQHVTQRVTQTVFRLARRAGCFRYNHH